MAAERREYLAGRIDDGPRERPEPTKVKGARARGSDAWYGGRLA